MLKYHPFVLICSFNLAYFIILVLKMSEKLRCGGLMQLVANNTIDCVNGGGVGGITGNIGKNQYLQILKKLNVVHIVH